MRLHRCHRCWPAALPGLLGLLAAAGPAAAQAPPAPAPALAVSALPPPTAADTVAAIRQAFRRRRQVAGAFIGASALGIAAAGAAATTQDHRSLVYLRPGDALILSSILLSPFWLFGLVQQSTYSHHREQAVVAAYERTHRLPPSLPKGIARRLVVGSGTQLGPRPAPTPGQP